MIVESSGTGAPIIGFSLTLVSPTSAKTRVLIVDVSALVSTETVTLTISGAVLASGTVQVIQSNSFAAGTSAPHVQSPPIVMPQGGTFQLQQFNGTARTFPWAVITLD